MYHFIGDIRQSLRKISEQMTNNTELAKHIRNIHFTLLLACFGMWITGKLAPTTPATGAYTELRAAQQITSNWQDWWKRYATEELNWFRSNDRDWIEPGPKFVRIHIPEIANPVFRNYPEFSSGRTSLRLSLDGPGLQLIGAQDDSQTGQPSKIFLFLDGSNFVPQVTPPSTLAQFIEFWDEPILRFRVGAPEPLVFIQSSLTAQSEIPWTLKRDTAYRVEQGLTLRLTRTSGCQVAPTKLGSEWSYCETHKIDPWGTSSLTVPTSVRYFQLYQSHRSWLAKQFNLGPSAGEFSLSFPELAQATVAYQDLTIDKVEAILKAEKDRSGERLEIVGLRVPVAQLSAWGSVFLLAIQFYLWVNLREFNQRCTTDDAAWSVPWVGLYRDRIVYSTCVLSVSAIPLGLIATLLWPWASDAGLAILVSALMMFSISGLFAGLTVHHLWLIRMKNLSRASPQNC